MKHAWRILLSLWLLAVLVLGSATPVAAFDGREGDSVVIGKDEVVNDDLYVASNSFTLEGAVNGDVIAVGKIVTINGKVDGDVMAAAQTVIINGEVSGSVRIAGAALLVGENATIGKDVISAGASLETRKGSQVGQDLVVFSAQALLAGEITRNAKISTGGTELRGTIGGDVEAEVGEAQHDGGPMVIIPETPIPIPNVQGGLTIDPAAKIGGKLTYTSAKELSLPGGVVAGQITRLEPKAEPIVQPPTASELFMTGLLTIVRNMVTLILIGLLLGWLFPNFLKTNIERVRTAPLPSFGWGLVSFAGFFFAVLVLIVTTVVGALIFGTLTLTGLTVTTVFLGLLSIFVLIFGFVLALTFVAKIILSLLGGKLILEKIKPEWAEHKVWPLVLGVILFVGLTAIPVLGWLAGTIAVLLGLGALWTYGHNLLIRKPAA